MRIPNYPTVSVKRRETKRNAASVASSCGKKTTQFNTVAYGDTGSPCREDVPGSLCSASPFM